MESHEPNPEEREAQIQRILRQVEQQLRQSLPQSRQPLEHTEPQVVGIGRQIREIIETEVLSPLDRDEVDPHPRCACGQPARYVAHYPRQLITLNGERRRERPTITVP